MKHVLKKRKNGITKNYVFQPDIIDIHYVEALTL
jgi:hypothetical protein